MTITLEHIQELRKGITPGDWQFSESQIESSTDDGFQDVIPTTGCLVCEDGYCELDISYDDPNVKAISLVPELLEMAEQGIREKARADALNALINKPIIYDFLEGVRLEAAHQKERWGYDHDYEKGPGDWSALVSYLHGKAMKALYDGDREKHLHHLVTMSAVIFHWHQSTSKWSVEAVIPELLHAGLSYDQIKEQYPHFCDRIEVFRQNVETRS
jgi:hypothetical protein